MGKLRLFFTFLCLTLSLTACVGPAPKAEFKYGERIQRIPVTDKLAMYAQNDLLLNNDTFAPLMKEKNPDFALKVEKANEYDKWAGIARLLQLGSLVGCFASTGHPADVSATLAWCGASLGFGIAVALPLETKAAEQRTEVVNSYNQSLSSAK